MHAAPAAVSVGRAGGGFEFGEIVLRQEMQDAHADGGHGEGDAEPPKRQQDFRQGRAVVIDGMPSMKLLLTS
jgi:hypothetical protein